MKTLLITGAEGFTGKAVVESCLNKGYEIVGGVRNRARKLAFEKQYGKALVCDVSDAINVARVVASATPDAVIHLAGTSLPHKAGIEPLEAYQSIVTAWANVLDAVRRVVPRARVVLASSCDVYGHAGQSGTPLGEDTPSQPANTFGALKATAESIAHTFFNNYHLNITIARPFHYTGPGQSPEFFFASVADRVVQASTPGQSIQLPDLDCRRDLLHVQDVVAAYQVLLEQGAPNETYNICSGKSWTVREICETVARSAGRSVSFTPLSVDGEDQVRVYCGDNSKLSALGWQPQHTFDQAIRDLVAGIQTAPQAIRT